MPKVIIWDFDGVIAGIDQILSMGNSDTYA